MSPPVLSSYERYLAVDLHKHYVVIGGLNARLEVILSCRRIELSEWLAWARKNLCKSDILVVEATTNAWDFYDEVAPLVGRVVVANAGKIAKLVKSKVKTDRTDVLKLAKLLVAGLIPEVWVPPDDVRELRTLMAHRRQLVKNCTMLKTCVEPVETTACKASSIATNSSRPMAACSRKPTAPGGISSLFRPQNACISSTTWRPSTTWLRKSKKLMTKSCA